MMSANDLTRKMLTGCGHTQAIIVPHDECVAAQLAQWEAAIRLDCARVHAREHRQSIDDNNAATELAKQEVEKLTRKADALSIRVTTLNESNALLRAELRAALAEIDDLSARLKAEGLQNQYAKYPQVVSE
jgi:hypothetical protein